VLKTVSVSAAFSSKISSKHNKTKKEIYSVFRICHYKKSIFEMKIKRNYRIKKGKNLFNVHHINNIHTTPIIFEIIQANDDVKPLSTTSDGEILRNTTYHHSIVVKLYTILSI